MSDIVKVIRPGQKYPDIWTVRDVNSSRVARMTTNRIPHQIRNMMNGRNEAYFKAEFISPGHWLIKPYECTKEEFES